MLISKHDPSKTTATISERLLSARKLGIYYPRTIPLSFSMNARAISTVVHDVDMKKDNLVRAASASSISKYSKIVCPCSDIGEVMI